LQDLKALKIVNKITIHVGSDVLLASFYKFTLTLLRNLRPLSDHISTPQLATRLS